MTEAVDIKAGLRNVLERISEASKTRSKQRNVQLVAVSKTKPVEAILEAYEEGQRHFGENYVQELQEKANNQLILEKCKDIKWHFIGHLQSNKVKKVVQLPNLYMIETIDNKKIAEAVNSSWEKHRPSENDKLKVLIQVNTSAEENKSGVDPKEVPELFKFMNENCKALDTVGLMTIGEYGYDYSKGPNPDFIKLLECATTVAGCENLELSFGMSDDFERAIELGSTIVRVGSSIFGYRQKNVYQRL